LPIYEYRCLKCGHQFEKLQKIADRPTGRCEKCNERVTRVFHPVAIHFKGSGFYSTDYGKKGSKAPARTEKKSGDQSKEKNDNQSQKKAATGSKEN
jgi:putative FmdB family regulatory protein